MFHVKQWGTIMIKYDVLYKTENGKITHELMMITQFEKLLERSTDNGNRIIIYRFQVFSTQEQLEFNYGVK